MRPPSPSSAPWANGATLDYPSPLADDLGMGCGNLEDGRFVFRCFTADALTESAETEDIER